MAKIVKEVEVTWSEDSGNIVTGTTLFNNIFSMLKQVSPDFVQVSNVSTSYPNDCYIYKDLKKTCNPGWYLYVEGGIGSHYANARTPPGIFKNTNDTITRNTIPAFCIFDNKINVEDQKSFPMRISVYESKNKKCWAFSAVRSSTTYDVWTGIIGIDSSGAAYAVSPNSACQGITFYGDADNSIAEARGTIPFKAAEQRIGIGANSTTLSLMPYINPTNGEICEDLYLPINGPYQTHVFDVTINGRNFVTAAFMDNSNPLNDEAYQAPYRLFMEV